MSTVNPQTGFILGSVADRQALAGAIPPKAGFPKTASTTTSQPKTTTTTTRPRTTTNTVTQPATGSINMSQGARDLLARTLQLSSLNDLEQYSWWNSNPNKQEAFNILQAAMSNPSGLANLVMATGTTELQSKQWWSTNPHRQQAWNIIDTSNQAPSGAAGPTDPTITGGVPTTAQPRTTTTNTNDQAAAATTSQGQTQSTFNSRQIIDDANIPPELKDLFRTIVDSYGPNDQINWNTVIQKTNEAARNTIDPYFQQIARQFEADIVAARDFQTGEREREIERERAEAGRAIRQAREGLSAAGMTFTGRAVETLGADSAYAQPGTDEATRSLMPTQTPFGGEDSGMFYEGTVNQANRLIQSSSLARFQNNLSALGRSAEERLGTTGALRLNIPGFSATGGITGSIDDQRRQAIGDQLNRNIQLQQAQINSRQPLNYNFNTSI